MITATEQHVISEVDPKRWDRLMDEFPQATIFHSTAWLRMITTCYNARVLLLQVCSDGQPQAAWPCLEMWKGLLRVVGSPLPGWSTAYMGPVFRPDADVNACLSTFLEHKQLRNPAYFACKVLNTGPAVDLAQFGFIEDLRFDTYCVDLTQTEEALWENLKSECRTRIRKAGKLGLEVREETTADFLDEFWTMSVETFANTNIQPTFSREFLIELWRTLYPLGQVKVLTAWLDGQRIGSLVLPFDKHTMYYWAGASYQRYRGIPAHNLLHWEAIQQAKRMGLKWYDFISTLGGAGRFKKTFGPEQIQIATHWERSQSKIIQALKNGYQNYLLRKRRLKALLCSPVLEPIMNFLDVAARV